MSDDWGHYPLADEAERERFMKWWADSFRTHYAEGERMLAWAAWRAALQCPNPLHPKVSGSA